jgi:hypothetical protein
VFMVVVWGYGLYAFSSNMNPPSLVPSQSWDDIFVKAFVILVIWFKSTSWHGCTIIH